MKRGRKSSKEGRPRQPQAEGNTPQADRPAGPHDDRSPVGLRIIGGKHRGRILQYSGDFRTRPMKDRVREAVFNLIGTEVEGKHAIDLFAGTGALGLEALSRGAVGVTLIERHLPTTRLIEQNAASIGVKEATRVIFGDAFRWAKQPTAPPDIGWVVFCSPPYDFYIERQDDMLQLVERLFEKAPPDSILVIEADERFDMNRLPGGDLWDVRPYPPAVVAIARTGTQTNDQ